MTTEEFNEKYKAYLEKGHYGLAFDLPEIIDYLDKEFQEFIKIPGFTYSQIKPKFNFIRFYANNLSLETKTRVEDKIKEIIDAEAKRRSENLMKLP